MFGAMMYGSVFYGEGYDEPEEDIGIEGNEPILSSVDEKPIILSAKN